MEKIQIYFFKLHIFSPLKQAFTDFNFRVMQVYRGVRTDLTELVHNDYQ